MISSFTPHFIEYKISMLVEESSNSRCLSWDDQNSLMYVLSCMYVFILNLYNCLSFNVLEQLI